jgi:hypothetical protein
LLKDKKRAGIWLKFKPQYCQKIYIKIKRGAGNVLNLHFIPYQTRSYGIPFPN